MKEMSDISMYKRHFLEYSFKYQKRSNCGMEKMIGVE